MKKLLLNAWWIGNKTKRTTLIIGDGMYVKCWLVPFQLNFCQQCQYEQSQFCPKSFGLVHAPTERQSHQTPITENQILTGCKTIWNIRKKKSAVLLIRYRCLWSDLKWGAPVSGHIENIPPTSRGRTTTASYWSGAVFWSCWNRLMNGHHRAPVWLRLTAVEVCYHVWGSRLQAGLFSGDWLWFVQTFAGFYSVVFDRTGGTRFYSKPIRWLRPTALKMYLYV